MVPFLSYSAQQSEPVPLALIFSRKHKCIPMSRLLCPTHWIYSLASPILPNTVNLFPCLSYPEESNESVQMFNFLSYSAQHCEYIPLPLLLGQTLNLFTILSYHAQHRIFSLASPTLSRKLNLKLSAYSLSTTVNLFPSLSHTAQPGESSNLPKTVNLFPSLAYSAQHNETSPCLSHSAQDSKCGPLPLPLCPTN